MNGEDFKNGFLEGFRMGFQEKVRWEIAEIIQESNGWEERNPPNNDDNILLEISMILKENEIIMQRMADLLKIQTTKRGRSKFSGEELKGLSEL